ncbi:MAG: hypothetical protein JXA52_02305, partial [Planctomycetes bacterium]|nr:hypothetical protein [Planctomycetota bacterium]
MTMRSVNLDGTWQLGWQNQQRYPDYQKRPRRGLIDVNVPGDIHLALFAAGKIGDPVIDDNNRRIFWLSKKEWWFYRDFKLDSFANQVIEMDFQGLDYEAEVWLNGRHVASHRNMFRPLRIDLTGEVKAKNSIAVRLLPHRTDLARLPEGSQMRMTGRPYIGFPEEVRTSRPWMRKAQYTFGWDWTQALYTCGIWRGVELKVMDRLAIEDEFAFTRCADQKQAELTFRCRSRSFMKLTASGVLTVDLYLKGKGRAKVATYSKEILLAPGSTEHELSGVLPSPELWWPLGYGEQARYEARFTIQA